MAKLQADPDVQYYLNHISAYEREFKKWESRVDKILKRYRDESRNANDTSAKFNILWSNVQTLKAATFAKMPKPDVSRRFRDNDAVGRVASLLLERALDYEITHYPDYRETLVSVISDRFIGGRGVSWVRYEPKFIPLEKGEDYDGDQITEDLHPEGEAEQGEQLDYECAPTDYVHWKDFGHSIGRTWDEVGIVWRRVYMTRPMLRERFPEVADSVPLDAQPDELKNASKEGVDKRALIYEIWDKESGEAYWLCKSMGKFLDTKPDPLGLEGFFPCPKPLFATLTNESLVPVPDFALYQDQANELDTLCDRIDGLTKALQVKGVYDASIGELSRLFTEGENNTLIPVKNWAAFAEKQGLKGAIDILDVTPIAQALISAYQAMEQVKSQIYDITGMSDIIRGQSEASETATAQKIKGQYASLRLKQYQDDVARFATGMLQLKAQIICQHFDPQTILQMAAADQLPPQDQQLIPQAIALLKNSPLRSFRVEVSTDSLIYMDEQQEKQDRNEFLAATSGFLEKAVQASTAAPQLVPLIMELLKFGVTGFRVGKTVEGQIDQTAEQLKQFVAQQAQNPKPDPEMEKLKAQGQLEQQRMGIETQKAQAQMQMEQQRMGIEHEKAQAQMQIDAQIEQMKLEFDKWKAELENQTKIIVAQIQAKASLKQTMVSTAASKAKEAESMGDLSQVDMGDGQLEPTITDLVQTITDNMQAMLSHQQQLHGEQMEAQRQAHAMLGQLGELQQASHGQLISAMTRPKTVVRGPDGRISGVQ